MQEILRFEHIDKRFMGVHALKDISFNLYNGEIHALMGENGAGKSTLMKILTGIYSKDSGKIYFQGELLSPKSPKEALDRGISIIHQELNMMEQLSVTQNIFIGRESLQNNKLLLDEQAQNKRAEQLFQQLNMDINPTELMSNLSVGKQQMVEIAKAVSFDLKVLVLDEPSAALTETEINELFAIMKDLANKGVSMIYISHRMNEIHRITDRVTVMRDGQYVATHKTAEVSTQDIINMMVGRVIYEQPKSKSMVAPDANIVMEVSNLNSGKMVNNISFQLYKGEILGFYGLIGAGRTETARAIFGADDIQSGKININGQLADIKNPIDAVRYGIGYLSEDRKRFGLATSLNVMENALMASYEDYQIAGFIDRQKAKKITSEHINKLKIKTPSVYQIVSKLSGGNQQKIVIAKWLINDAQILIFDEPTRGIDVGAKSEIYHLMNELVQKGKSIIMISSELPEILRMSDRIIVMCEGSISGELDIENLSQEMVMQYATKRDS